MRPPICTWGYPMPDTLTGVWQVYKGAGLGAHLFDAVDADDAWRQFCLLPVARHAERQDYTVVQVKARNVLDLRYEYIRALELLDNLVDARNDPSAIGRILDQAEEYLYEVGD